MENMRYDLRQEWVSVEHVIQRSTNRLEHSDVQETVRLLYE